MLMDFLRGLLGDKQEADNEPSGQPPSATGPYPFWGDPYGFPPPWAMNGMQKPPDQKEATKKKSGLLAALLNRGKAATPTKPQQQYPPYFHPGQPGMPHGMWGRPLYMKPGAPYGNMPQGRPQNQQQRPPGPPPGFWY